MFLVVVVEAHKLHLSMDCQVERACSSEISLYIRRIRNPKVASRGRYSWISSKEPRYLVCVVETLKDL